MASYKLASEKLKGSGGSGSGLSPVQFTAGAGSRIVAPQVSTNAANVKFTPMPVPNIVEDQLSNSVQQFGQVWAKAAADYSLREDGVVANNAITAYSSKLQEMYNGKVNPETGAFEGGYKASKELAASQGFGTFKDSVASVRDQITETLTPRQKQLALAAMVKQENTILGKASTHAVSELAAAEESSRGTAFDSLAGSIAPDNIDIGGAAEALSLYKDDPVQWNAKNVQLTKQLIYTAAQNGPQEAERVATALMATPGIGDAMTLDTYRQKSRDRAWAEESHGYTRASERRARAVESANNASTLIGSALNKPSDMGYILNEMSNQIGPHDALQKMQSDVPLYMEEDWELSKANGIDFDVYAARQRESIADMPVEIQDDMYRKLDVMEDEQEKAILADMKRKNGITGEINKTADIAKDGDVDVLTAKIRSMSKGSPMIQASIDEFHLKYKGDITDAQHRKIEGAITGRFYEDQLYKNEFYSDPEKNSNIDLIKSWPVSEETRTELLKAAQDNIRRRADAAQKTGTKALEQMFKIHMDPYTRKMVGEEQQKKDYRERALPAFNRMFRFNMTKEGGGMNPDEAQAAAFTELKSLNWFNQMAVGTHEFDDPNSQVKKTIFENHDAVHQSYQVRSSLPGVKGNVNLTKWVPEIGLKHGKDVDPSHAILGRAVEVNRAFETAINGAKDIREMETLIEERNQFANQFQYMDKLLRDTKGDFTTAGKVVYVTDGDTFVVDVAGGKDITGREKNIDAADKTKPTGEDNMEAQQAATQDLVNVLDKLTSGTGMVNLTGSGAGAWKRMISELGVAEEDVGTIMNFLLNHPLYNAKQRASENEQRAKAKSTTGGEI